MSRISQAFHHRQAFVAYLTAGDGGLQRTLNAMLALVKGGVDVLEVGMPFSDPVADGPTIQQAAMRALAAGTTLDGVLQMIHDFRQHSDVPIILFSYYNPIYQAAQNGFFNKAKNMGVDGCLIVDLPMEESAEYQAQCLQFDIDPIYIVSTSTAKERVQDLDKLSKGMLYYACRKGVTGVKNSLPEDFVSKLTEIKANAHWPVVAGFGISDCVMAAAVLEHADGFVVGSRFVEAIAKGATDDELTQLAKNIDPR